MSRSRKEVLADALKTEIGAASGDLKTLFTDDVTGWSPYVTLSGLAALADLAALREAASRRRDHVPGNRRSGQQGVRRAARRSHYMGLLVLSGDTALVSDGGTSLCPVSPWPTSVTGRSGPSGRTSMTCR